MSRGLNRRPPLPQQKPAAGRVPVNDLDAEAAVISAMLLSREAVQKVRPILRPPQCYSDANARIVEAIYELSDQGVPVDIVSVGGYLRERERLAQVGGPTYLAQLADATPAVAHVEVHARIVVRAWVQRAAGAIGHSLAADSYGDVGDVRQWIAAARAALDELAETGREHSEELIRPVLGRVIREVEGLAEDGKRSLGIRTGFAKLDKSTAGLVPGRVSYIAARPGVGKSSLARNIVANVAAIQEVIYGIIVIQLEGTREEVARGMLCSEAKVDTLKMAEGLLQPDDWRAMTDVGAWMAQLPIWIEDRPCTVDDMIAIVRRKQAEFDRPATATRPEQKVGLVVVDYVQRVRAEEEKDKRSEELAQISRRLKEDLAKGCNVHVLALAAMNRDVEKRKGNKPQLSDLRDCGDLESDADLVVFLDRPLSEKEDDKGGGKGTGDAEGGGGVATGFIAKNRHGLSGNTFKLRFFAPYARFVEPYEGEEL